MFDDVNMSPQHGIDLSQVHGYGPWMTDAQYGDDLVATVEQVAAAIARPSVSVAVNLGVTTWDPALSAGRTGLSTGVQRALSLAASGHVNIVVTKFAAQWSDRTALNNAELSSRARFDRQIAATGPTVIVHDYSVDLRNVPATAYASGQPISSSAACLARATATPSVLARQRHGAPPTRR